MQNGVRHNEKSMRVPKKIIFFHVLIICSLFNYSYAQTGKFSKSTLGVVKKIKNVDYIMVNYELTKRSIRLANKLNKLATDNELLALVSDTNRIVRCFSFWVLAKRSYSKLDSIFQAIGIPIVDTESNSFNGIEINKVRNSKSDVIMIILDYSFIEDIYLKRKYIDLIK